MPIPEQVFCHSTSQMYDPSTVPINCILYLCYAWIAACLWLVPFQLACAYQADAPSDRKSERSHSVVLSTSAVSCLHPISWAMLEWLPGWRWPWCWAWLRLLSPAAPLAPTSQSLPSSPPGYTWQVSPTWINHLLPPTSSSFQKVVLIFLYREGYGIRSAQSIYWEGR